MTKAKLAEHLIKQLPKLPKNQLILLIRQVNAHKKAVNRVRRRKYGYSWEHDPGYCGCEKCLRPAL